MSSTNKTPNLELSQFIGSDKPTWLGDVNGDMVKIDTGVATAIETAENAEQTASSLQTTVGGLQTTVSGHTSSISSLQSAQTTQGNAINDLASDQAATESIVNGLSAKVGTANISSVAPDLSQAVVVLAEREVATGEGNYSLTEVDTGLKWIDGKTIYKKTINFGQLPNATGKAVSSIITGITKIIDFKMIADAVNGSVLPIPYASGGSLTDNIRLNLTLTTNEVGVSVFTYIDRTSYSAYITIYYVK